MAALDSATPDRITGRRVSMYDGFAVAASLLPQGQKFSVAARKELMRTHSDAYMQLDQATRPGYARRAMDRDHTRLSGMKARRRALQDEADLVQLRAEAELASRNPWRMSSCKMFAADRSQLEALLASVDFSRSKVQALRATSRQAPLIQDTRSRLSLS